MTVEAKPSADVLRFDHPPEIPGADHFVKIPDGEYVVDFLGAESFWYRGKRPRLALWFQVVEGDLRGEKIAAYCNLKSLDSPPGHRSRDPKFVVGWRSDLTMILATLFPERYSAANLPTSIPVEHMLSRAILVETRSVTSTHSGKKRPSVFHSSVVASVNGWASS
jgi:hypothetical protein